MTLLELNENYYFHDSVLEKIEYMNNDLKLYCGFCNFLQKTRGGSIDFFMEFGAGKFGNLIIDAESVEVITLNTYNL